MEFKLNNLNNAHSPLRAGRGLRLVKGGTLYRQNTVFVQGGQKKKNGDSPINYFNESESTLSILKGSNLVKTLLLTEMMRGLWMSLEYFFQKKSNFKLSFRKGSFKPTL